jgi:hypothetical protein
VLGLLLHSLNGVLAGVLAFALTANAVAISRASGHGMTMAMLPLGFLLVVEFTLAGWLFMRRSRMRRLVTSSRRALAEGDSESARQDLLAMLEFLEYRADPGPVYYGLGLADVLDGELERALELLRIAGRHRGAMELRVMLCIATGRSSQARRLMPVLRTLAPRDPGIEVLAAAVAQESGSLGEARALLNAAAQKWDKSPVWNSALAKLDAGAPLLDLTGWRKHEAEEGRTQ